MHDIPKELITRLRAVLSRCGSFESNQTLEAVFIDTRIGLWRDQVPETSSKVARVNTLIANLSEKYNTQDENALVLFLKVLQDEIDPGDQLYEELNDLAEDLANEIEKFTKVARTLAAHIHSTAKGEQVLELNDVLAEQFLLLLRGIRDQPTETNRLLKELGKQGITITGDGNVVGNNNEVIRVEGFYAQELIKEIGRITTDEPKKVKNLRLSLVVASMLVVIVLLLIYAFCAQETPPIIQEFLVHYPDSSIRTFTAGDLVEISAYTPVLVEAIFLDQDRALCTWSTVKGLLLPVGRCGTQYNPPLDENQDTLTVLAQSPRKQCQTFAGLHISVLQAQQEP